jgi:hypothetical protein
MNYPAIRDWLVPEPSNIGFIAKEKALPSIHLKTQAAPRSPVARVEGIELSQSAQFIDGLPVHPGMGTSNRRWQNSQGQPPAPAPCQVFR